MARIKIEMPAVKLAEIIVPVRITDINYGNHVGNDAFVAIIHEARLQWLQQNGYTELNFDEAALIMGDLAIEFKHEAFYGDHIVVKIFAGEISRVSFELFYELTAKRNEVSVLLAHAKTGMIYYNYTAKKTASLTDAVKLLLAGT